MILPGNADNTSGQLYQLLHRSRIEAQQAREALQRYAPNQPKALQAHMFALEGYTVLWFAELYCSGIPLSSAPLVGRAVMTRGFTTQELFEHAIALFDSALALGADSARFSNLAAVGKGRALLGLGRFAAADSAVIAVPTDFVYNVQFAQNSDLANTFVSSVGIYRTQDGEGRNGLVWSTDPRTAIAMDPDNYGSMLLPDKYVGIPGGTPPADGSPVRMADGLEARLIQAEAALAAGSGSWLTTLNTLRATCVGAAACAPVPDIAAGALPPLGDPGTAAARLDTLMKERAMWLFMTGHREGDLRRLAHIYQRDPSTLWPTGVMSVPAFPPAIGDPGSNDGVPYGTSYVFYPNSDEQANNPFYGGCYDTAP